MIDLPEDKELFILEDLQGMTFGGGRIFEGLKELKEQFQEYAEMDGYDDPTLKEWPIGECLENWGFNLWKYDGTRFRKIEDEALFGEKRILNYK